MIIAPYTALLHSIMATLCLASCAYLFAKKNDTNAQTVSHFFYWFLYFFLYNISLIVPLLLFKKVSPVFGYFYIAALVFLGIAAWQAFKAGMPLLTNTGLRKFWNAFFIAGTATGVLLQFIFFEVPKFAPGEKFIIWYSGSAAYVYIFLCLSQVGFLQFLSSEVLVKYNLQRN